jgi:hypothetical protein
MALFNNQMQIGLKLCWTHDNMTYYCINPPICYNSDPDYRMYLKLKIIFAFFYVVILYVTVKKILVPVVLRLIVMLAVMAN